ncbi:hypothetical protein N8654_02200 [Synechococcus sp. AH-601-B19]|nr:hypothetical protein [Synechococcus sp. AH-601-B19]
MTPSPRLTAGFFSHTFFKTMSNQTSIFTPEVVGTGTGVALATVATGGGGIGLAMAGGAMALPFAGALAIAGGLGWLCGQVWRAIAPKPKSAARKVINVTAVTVEVLPAIDFDEVADELFPTYGRDLELLAQGIF